MRVEGARLTPRGSAVKSFFPRRRVVMLTPWSKVDGLMKLTLAAERSSVPVHPVPHMPTSSAVVFEPVRVIQRGPSLRRFTERFRLPSCRRTF